MPGGAKFVRSKGLSENIVLRMRITVASSFKDSRGCCPLVNFQDGPIVPTIHEAPPDGKSHLDVIQITISLAHRTPRKSGPIIQRSAFCWSIVRSRREPSGRLVLKTENEFTVRTYSRVQKQTGRRLWRRRGPGNLRRHSAWDNDRTCPSAANCRAVTRTAASRSTPQPAAVPSHCPRTELRNGWDIPRHGG